MPAQTLAQTLLNRLLSRPPLEKGRESEQEQRPLTWLRWPLVWRSAWVAALARAIVAEFELEQMRKSRKALEIQNRRLRRKIADFAASDSATRASSAE